jgi:hypothetical protein
MLKRLPEGLDETYKQCLKRIDDDEVAKVVAPRVFRWISRARRPLTMSEMQSIVFVDPDDSQFNVSHIMTTNALDYCSNLISFDVSGRFLRFTHVSVNQFLEDSSRIPKPLSRYVLQSDADDLFCASVCLTYMKWISASLPTIRHPVLDNQATSLPRYLAQTMLPRPIGTVLLKNSGFRRKTAIRRSTVPEEATSTATTPFDTLVCDTTNQVFQEYVQDHWLSHTRSITHEWRFYSLFKAFCLVRI